jgi:hypothetical protein
VKQLSPFKLMNTVFGGLLISLGYGLASVTLVYFLETKSDAQKFWVAYASSFNTLISLGLIVGTALIVFRSQFVIPQIITSAFPATDLPVEYFAYKRKFLSLGDSITFMAEFSVVAFIVFTYCQFPLSPLAEALMILAACTQYALGVYVGRKLCFAGLMLHSLLDASVKHNLFKERKLDEINTYVHIASTLTIVFVYVHVRGYYEGPFLYHSMFGESLRLFLILPAVIATPVLLIFNFYPRVVLRRLYGESINVEIKALKQVLQDEGSSPSEKRSHLIAFDKMCRDELRYSLQLTLSDLPIGITILIMVVEPLVRH